MSKIFENWNKFVNESDTITEVGPGRDPVDPGVAQHARARAAKQAADPTQIKRTKNQQRQKYYDDIKEIAGEILEFTQEHKEKTSEFKKLDKQIPEDPESVAPISDDIYKKYAELKGSIERLESEIKAKRAVATRMINQGTGARGGPEVLSSYDSNKLNDMISNASAGTTPMKAMAASAAKKIQAKQLAGGDIGGTVGAAATPAAGASEEEKEKAKKGKKGKTRRGYRVISKYKRKGMPATRAELRAFYKEIKEKGLSKTLGKADFVWGRKHAVAFDALQKLKPAAEKGGTGEVRFIPNLPAPPKAITAISPGEASVNEQTEEPGGKGPLAKLYAAQPSGTKSKPAKGSKWGQLNVGQVKQAMANRKRFGLTNTPDEDSVVIADPDFKDYFGLSIPEARKSFEANASRGRTQGRVLKDMPTGKERMQAIEIEKLKSELEKLKALKGKPDSKLKDKLKDKVKDAAEPVTAPFKRVPKLRRGFGKDERKRAVYLFKQAQRIYAAADGFTDDSDEDVIRTIVNSAMNSGNMQFLFSLYHTVLKNNNALERGDLYQELVNEDMPELAAKVLNAMRAKDYEGKEFYDLEAMQESKGKKDISTKITMSVLREIIKEEMKNVKEQEEDEDEKKEREVQQKYFADPQGITVPPATTSPERPDDLSQQSLAGDEYEYRGTQAALGAPFATQDAPKQSKPGSVKNPIDLGSTEITGKAKKAKPARSRRQAHRALYKARKAAKAAAKAQGLKSWRKLPKSDPARKAFSKAYRVFKRFKKADEKRGAALKARIQRGRDAKEASRIKPSLQGGTGTSGRKDTMAPVQPKGEMFD